MNKNLIISVLAIISVGLLAYFLMQNDRTTITSEQSNFATEDTSAIAKIVISDTYGKQVKLSRNESNGWVLNDTLTPRAEAIGFVLEAIHGFKVKSGVAKASLELLFKRIAAMHIKVDLYEADEKKPFKTIYISDSNKELSGNLALLETKSGRSNTPFYIHLEGHKGIVKPIFFTNELEWMDTRIFKYPNLDFKSITVQNYTAPEQSFKVEKSDNGLAIFDLKNLQYLNGFDTLYAYDYVNQYQKVYYEVRDHYLNETQQDSITNQQPIYQVTVEEKDGSKNSIKLFEKGEVIRTIDFDVKDLEKDRDRMYGLYKGNLVLCQKFTFNRILVNLDNFK